MHNEEKEIKIIVFYTCYFVDGGYDSGFRQIMAIFHQCRAAKSHI